MVVVHEASSDRGPPRLSPRQREVLEHMARGLSNKEIGTALAISAETVRTHASAVLVALGASNRTEAARMHLEGIACPQVPEAVLARPAIAVLPLRVAPPRPAANALGLAVARELTTLLSRWSWFPVIAHAATRDARAQGATIRELGHALGARFLVDGLVHPSRAAWRLSVEIADASTGASVWSERYEFTARRWLTLADEVCAAIVGACYPRMVAAVQADVARQPAIADVPAWRMTHRALLYHEARERGANRLASAGFAAALAREPTMVLAHFGAGLVAYDAVLNQWAPPGAALASLERAAERCVALAPALPEGHFLVARGWQARGQHDRAQAPLRAAIACNPSFAAAYELLAQTLILTGRRDEGVARMAQACRLDPRSFVTGLAVAHFARGDYAAARVAVERALAANPTYPFARALATACTWWLDDLPAARAHAAALPAGFAPTHFARTFGGEVDAVARLVRALRAVARVISAGSGSTSQAPRRRPTAR